MLKRAFLRTASPLVGVDAESWKVNAMISGAVLLVFSALPVFEAVGATRAVPYVDPFLVSIVVAISISIPVRIAWQAPLALLNRAPPANIRAPIEAAVSEALWDPPMRAVHVCMVTPGRKLYVIAHVLMPEDCAIDGLRIFDRIRGSVAERVRAVHDDTIVDVLFTGDERWAVADAPSGTTGNAQ